MASGIWYNWYYAIEQIQEKNHICSLHASICHSDEHQNLFQ